MPLRPLLVVIAVLAACLGAPLAATARAAGAPAPSSAAAKAAVAKLTGLPASQVAAAHLCARPQAGQVACDAQVLVSSSSHQRIHPDVQPQATFTQVFPRRRTSAPAAASTGQAATSPPEIGDPAWLQQAYDLTYLSQIAGASDTVAIVDAYDDPAAESDLNTYRSYYGLPACTTANGCFRKLNQSGQASPLPAADSGWAGEESLDLDAVSALCPNCHIMLVEAQSSYTSDLDTAIATAKSLGANQISNSWSGTSSSPDGTSSYPGVAVIAATGDSGYVGSHQDAYPAAFPTITAAGGTSLTPTTDPGNLRGFSETAWAYDSYYGWGGGSGCDLQEAKPAWQSDSGCTGRAYADVSADADPYTGIYIYDKADGGWEVMGGTSLATPLIAAYEAVTGVDGTSPAWAYAKHALLNDPVSGSVGNCAASIAYICNARSGYDGPTGEGSISGAVTSGGPGIAGPAYGSGSDDTYSQSLSASSATLAGGVYPNGLDATAYWQYGTSTSYGQQSPATDLGAGSAVAAESAQLSGLAANTTYHYRLVAANADGTSYGYDYTFKTGASAPVAGALPQLSAGALQGQLISASTGSWTPSSGVSLALQWRRSSDGATWSAISGATSSSYTPTSADVGRYLDLLVTASDSAGSTTAVSAPSAPIASAAPALTSPPSVSGQALVGQTLQADPGSWTPAGVTLSVSWQRSFDGGSSWSTISFGTSYTAASADAGALLRVLVSARNAYGQASQASAAVGPVTAPVTDPPPSSTDPVIPPPTTTSPVPVGSGGGGSGGGGSSAGAPVARLLPRLAGTPRVGARITVLRGRWSASPDSDVLQVMRCTTSCVVVATLLRDRGRAVYGVSAGDAGATLWVRETATNSYGATVAWSARSLGPVVSARAAAARLRTARSTLRTASGRVLGKVVLRSTGHARMAKATARPSETLLVTRPAAQKRPLRLLVCPVVRTESSAAPRCAGFLVRGRRAALTLPAWLKGGLRATAFVR